MVGVQSHALLLFLRSILIHRLEPGPWERLFCTDPRREGYAMDDLELFKRYGLRPIAEATPAAKPQLVWSAKGGWAVAVLTPRFEFPEAAPVTMIELQIWEVAAGLAGWADDTALEHQPTHFKPGALPALGESS